jgi:hypothetical protein
MYGGGNVFACICYDEVDDEGKTTHHLVDFIVDKEHLENILKDYRDGWYYNDITLNGSIRESWSIAKTLVKYDISVTMVSKFKEVII